MIIGRDMTYSVQTAPLNFLEARRDPRGRTASAGIAGGIGSRGGGRSFDPGKRREVNDL